ncbi:retrotransposon protein, putative, ty1-copia subclass [Tanacetum coccineum]
MDNSKRGHIPMQERFELNKTQGASTPEEVKPKYIAASEAAMEAVWIRKFISGLGIILTINEPIGMFCDNSAALHFANEPGVQKGTRHHHRRYHYVRECFALREIKFLKVHTDDNLADPFTKALPKGKLTQHARSMGLRLASSFIDAVDGDTESSFPKYFPCFDQPFEEVVYLKGEIDVVSIGKRDVDMLLRDTFVNDTINDFYIKYLKSKINPVDRLRFHFLNSFFFQKLADSDKEPLDACK